MGSTRGSNSPMVGPASARHSDQAFSDHGDNCSAARSLPSEAVPRARCVRIAGSWLARVQRLDQQGTGSTILATTPAHWQFRENLSNRRTAAAVSHRLLGQTERPAQSAPLRRRDGHGSAKTTLDTGSGLGPGRRPKKCLAKARRKACNPIQPVRPLSTRRGRTYHPLV